MLIEFLDTILVNKTPVVENVRLNLQPMKCQLRLKLTYIEGEVKTPLDFVVFNWSPQLDKLALSIKIDGKEYVVLEKVEDMTAGQYIDYETYLQQNDIKMLPYILTCLIIPKGEKYGESDTSNELMQLSVEEALSIADFFMKRSRSLIRGTLLSLEWMMKKKAKKMKDETMKAEMDKAVKEIHLLQSTIKNGDGFLALTQFLRR